MALTESISDVYFEWRKKELQESIEAAEKTKSILAFLPQRLEHKGLIPLNSVCSFEGKVVDTNRVIVKCGDFAVEKTCHGAIELLNRKIERSLRLISLQTAHRTAGSKKSRGQTARERGGFRSSIQYRRTGHC